jgi:hypothetical protein
MEKDLSTRYTVVPIIDPSQQAKLVAYLEENQHLRKTSFCRFYLRGLCIMKSEHCKFAHDFDDLQLQEMEYKQLALQEFAVSEKEERKKMFLEKTDFHQRPLFFLRHLDYTWLYRYQFTPRYQLANTPAVPLEEINKDERLRHRIRDILHREQWDKVIAFIEETFPEADFTIDTFSAWFAALGLEKAQTCCKFGDFMRYLTCVKGYVEVNVVVPPRVGRSIFYLKQRGTFLHSRLP